MNRRRRAEDAGLTRRRALGSIGALVGAALAGCFTINEYVFTAQPVILPPAERERMGYRRRIREVVTIERREEVGGVGVEATIRNHLAVYDREASPSVGVLSTPESEVRGQSLNPIVRLSTSELLTSDVTLEFLRESGLQRIGGYRESVEWTRGPTVVGQYDGRLVGHETEVEVHAGILSGDPPAVAYVHLTRVQDRTVVLASGVHGFEVERVDRPFVDPDEGYLTPGELDDAVSSVGPAIEAMAYE